MERKKFLQSSLLGSTGLLVGKTPGSISSPGFKVPDDAPFHLNYATHDGMFKNSAGDDFIEQIKFAHANGFRSIEDNGMMGRSADMQQKIGDALASHGMSMGVFVLEKGGNGANTLAAGKPEYVEIFLKGCREAIDVSKRCGGKLTTVVPGDFERHLPMGIQTASVIAALRRGVEILEPHGIVMVLEPLSDTPDLFLRTADQAFAICKAVSSPVCKILFDMYHIQRNTGNLIRNIDWTYDEIGYFQIGNNPGRNEPGTGEMDYHNIFKHIYEKGYKGMLGMEHGNAKPGKDGESALIKAYRDADNFQ
ncbi:MAG TPA: TIM barrel protein [Puia sp.]|nr:TIM barrel protein [Puia sp.]